MDHHKGKCTRHQKWSNLKCVAYTAANLQALLVRLKLDVTLCILMCLFYNKQFMSLDVLESTFSADRAHSCMMPSEAPS